MLPIRKAVFPVAGLGTRFLPATKAMPKEMLPIVDRPLIQYAVEEAVAAGITELIFVTGRNKRAIEDHFDRVPELERDLELKNKAVLLDSVRNVIPETVKCVYTRQPAALGLGHAVLCAASIVGNEPFAVLLADDMIDAETPVIGEMMKVAREFDGSVIAVQKVPPAHTRGINVPIAVAIAIPLLLIAGTMLAGLALFMALPAYVVVLVWNQLAPAQHWPMLAYWPTLGLMMLTFILLTVAQWTRRLRVYLNQSR